MGQTSNYGLKQWEDWEIPRRADLNQVVGSIDTALAELPYVVGQVSSMERSTTFHLGFQPTAGFLMSGEVIGFFTAAGGCYRSEQGEDSGFTVSLIEDGVTLTAGKSAFFCHYPVGYIMFR